MDEYILSEYSNNYNFRKHLPRGADSGGPDSKPSSYWDALESMVTDEEKDLLKDFVKFLKRAFVADPTKRPTAKELQEDKWTRVAVV